MKSVMRMATFGAMLTVAVSTVPTMAIAFGGAQDQDHNRDQTQQHSDYSNNSYYKQGNSEGYQEFKHKTHKEYKHKYSNDADRRAHDYGYQQGLQGHQGYHKDSDSHQ